MAETVTEQLAETAVLNVAARYPIGIPARHAPTHRADGLYYT